MSQLTELFTNIANSIRNVSGETGQIAANEFPTKIAAIGSETVVFDYTPSGTGTTQIVTQAIGKDNVMIFLKNHDDIPNISYVLLEYFVNGSGLVIYLTSSGRSIRNYTSTWDKTTGTLDMDGSSTLKFNTKYAYMGIAW